MKLTLSLAGALAGIAFLALANPAPRGPDPFAQTIEQLDALHREQVESLRGQVDDAEAKLAAAVAALPEWKPGTQLTPGGFWRLPEGGVGVTITIDQPYVTFLGGWVYPENGPAFDVRPGGDHFTAIGTRVHHPNPPFKPSGGRDVPAVLFSRAKRPTLLNCEFGTVGEIAKLWPGGDRALVAGCRSGRDVYSAAVGCWGADETVVVFNDFPNSVTENLVRFSPQGEAVPHGAVVAFNALGNPGNKSVIDFRHITDGVALGNDLYTDEHGTAIGVGRGNGPGAENIRLLANRLHGSRIHVHQARGLTVEDNAVLWKTQGVNNAIYIGLASDVQVRRNRGPEPAPGKKWNEKKHAWEPIPPKSIMAYTATVTGIDDDGTSQWDRPASRPATQPSTQPAQ